MLFRSRACWVAVVTCLAAGCPPPLDPAYPSPGYRPTPRPADEGPAPAGGGAAVGRAGAGRGAIADPVAVDVARLGVLDDRMVDFVFDGGQLELEMYRAGPRVVQVARSRYAVPIVIRWTLTALDNVEAAGPADGTALLPPAPVSGGTGPTVVLTELTHLDVRRRYRRELYFRGRFGDPRAEPTPYVYRLPFPAGSTYTVLQGFHGAFSHRGSNEYAVDFDCPVATPVLAARAGVVVASNAAAQGAGSTPEYMDYKRTNFVLVLHDDGTLGEYMHLAPSSVEVKPGQRVARGQSLALSGNTGFSSTPHLHFQVITAGDGITGRSFPFRFAVAPGRAEYPEQGRRYTAWETSPAAR